MDPRHVDVMLDEEHATTLRRIAQRVGTTPEALAGALLSGALEGVRRDGVDISTLLERIPGAADAVREGERDAAAGRTIPLDRL
jgi:predicted transcriptional regulator